MVILEYNICGYVDLDYLVNGEEAYDDLADDSVSLRNMDLDLTPLVERFTKKWKLYLANLYEVPSSMFDNQTVTINWQTDRNQFEIDGLMVVDVKDDLSEVATSALSDKTMRHINDLFDDDVENVINVEPLNEMIEYDYSIDFYIKGLDGLGVSVKETRD